MRLKDNKYMAKARFASKDEQAAWDEHVGKDDGPFSFFQQTTFLDFKCGQQPSPWRVRYVIHPLGKDRELYAAYLVKSIPLCGEYWYAPGGPLVKSAADLKAILKQLTEIAPKAFTILLEPSIQVASEEEVMAFRQNLPMLTPAAGVQPNLHTVIIDTSPDEASILAGFKQRARRAIRQAEKAGVTVRQESLSEATMQKMWELYQQTADRAGFYIRKAGYYRRFWQQYNATGQGSFFFAYNSEEGGEPIAGIFVLHSGDHALYKDGASLRGDKLPTGSLHLLQWETIKRLKAIGVKQYDLHGTPPSWLQDDTTHRQHGLGIFKTSFNQVTDTVGAYEYIVKPARYQLWVKAIRKIVFTSTSRRGGYFY